MEHQKIIEYPFPDTPTDRSYQCPCSKTYKSYPALYTHIKNKHQGQAPGPITKPTLPFKKRGRPAANRSRTSLDTQLYLPSDSNIPPQFSEASQSQINELDLTPQLCVLTIKSLLQRMPVQDFKNLRLSEISAATEMVVYMSTRSIQIDEYGIFSVVSQFLQQLSKCLSWSKSKPFYILLMVFLQYILEVDQQIKGLKQLEADSLCEYLNEFIQTGASRITQAFLISQLAVFESGTMTQIFSWFFRWMFLKNYSTYRIIRNQHVKRNQTRSEF